MVLLTISVAGYGQQQLKFNNAPPKEYGKYTTLTNSSEIAIGTDSVSAGGVSYELLYMINTNDTGFSLNKVVPRYYGKWNSLTNNGNIVFGTDTAKKGDISAKLVYIMNNNLANTNLVNNFTATQYFNRIIADTLTVNHMDSVHSTYWYSNVGDTIGYIDAATEKIAFFRNMTLSDTVTAKKIITDTVKVNNLIKVGINTKIFDGYIIITAGTTLASNSLFFASSIGEIRGYDYSNSRVILPYKFSLYNSYIDSNLFTSGNLTVNKVFKLNTISTPSSPQAGDMYSDGTHAYYYNGTAWKQLDN